MTLNAVQIDSFAGGINTMDAEQELLVSEMGPNTRNVEIVGNGSRIRSRRPAICWDPSGAAIPAVAANTPFSSIATYKLLPGNRDSIITSNDNGKVLTIVPGSWPAAVATQIIAGSGGPGKEWMFEQSSDSATTQKVYMLNGVDAPQYYHIGLSTVSAWPGSPPNGKTLKSWKTMMCIAGVAAQPQRLYFSQPNNPELWTTPGGFIDIKSVDDDTDEIVALETVGENLLVFKKRSVWAVFDPATFDNRRIAAIGVWNKWSTGELSDRVYFVGSGGCYSTDGEDIKLESQNINSIFTSAGFSDSFFARVASTFENRLYVKVSSNLLVMDANLTRQDGQHPWVIHSSSSFIVESMVRATEDSGTGDLHATMVAMIDVTPGHAQIPVALFTEWGIIQSGDLVNGSVGAISSVAARYDTPYLPIQGVELEERVRRVSIVLDGVVDVNIYKDFGAVAAAFLNQVPTNRYLRVRPETRGRYHRVSVVFNETDNSAFMQLDGIELKYRGGVEH